MSLQLIFSLFSVSYYDVNQIVFWEVMWCDEHKAIRSLADWANTFIADISDWCRTFREKTSWCFCNDKLICTNSSEIMELRQKALSKGVLMLIVRSDHRCSKTPRRDGSKLSLWASNELVNIFFCDISTQLKLWVFIMKLVVCCQDRSHCKVVICKKNCTPTNCRRQPGYHVIVCFNG